MSLYEKLYDKLRIREWIYDLQNLTHFWEFSAAAPFKDGYFMNHFEFFKETGKYHINSWTFFFLDAIFLGHIFKLDPDICCRCGVFVG